MAPSQVRQKPPAQPTKAIRNQECYAAGKEVLVTWCRAYLMTVVATFAVGCSLQVEQEGEFEAQSLAIEGCKLPEPFVLDLDFVAFDDCDDILFLRLQKGGRAVSDSDGIEIQISELAKVTEQVKSAPLSLDLQSKQVRLTLFLNDSCPNSFASLEAGEGQITIVALKPRNDGKLELSATFDLVDLRDGDTVAEDASLTLDATLTTAAPYKSFAYCN